MFSTITERTLLERLKDLCAICGFDNPEQYKLHSFRHHFVSLCANHHVAYRKALAWLGHSSSQMLDLYYHLYDEDSQEAMAALAMTQENRPSQGSATSPFEGDLRAMRQSTIEKLSQSPELQELIETIGGTTERAGF